MANLHLSFTFKDAAFCLCATVNGTSKRNYEKVLNMVNPNFDVWDNKKQMFNEPTNDAITNNRRLDEMKKNYQYLIDTFNPLTGKDLFSLFNNAEKVEAKKEITLGEYLKILILNLKGRTHNRLPSANHQVYTALLHKLEKENSIINVPLSEIDDTHFENFGKFIIDTQNGLNYKNLMKRFKTVINKARKDSHKTAVLEYPYMDNAPKSELDFIKATKGVTALSKKQYDKFTKMDLSTIEQSGINPEYYKELYRDFCIFMYEMKLRPCDAIALHNDNIEKDVMTIFVIKKRNNKNIKSAVQKNPLTPKAKEIIKKYGGQSKGGYIFPFSMNEKHWDLENATVRQKWYNRKQNQLCAVNKFLHKFRPVFDIDDLKLYDFRHSTFTHEIKEGKKPLMQIAKEGGTSVSMLEKYYFNHIAV